jgi:soluble lytic murein transglycosylase-like protein
MIPASLLRRGVVAAVVLAIFPPLAHASQRVTLTNGFALDCVREEVVGDRIRLYFSGSEQNFMEVAAKEIVRIETVPDPPPVPAAVTAPVPAIAKDAMDGARSRAQPTPVELKELLAKAGAQHNIDAELLAAVVHAESGGQLRAVSRTGAQGLMQLMPATAHELGVQDAFVADQNVEGGTKYLDQMLTRYHDNIALALAAYNAGPGAVDRCHGVPPYRETREYVARVIREFNRRKTTPMVASDVGGAGVPLQQ